MLKLSIINASHTIMFDTDVAIDLGRDYFSVLSSNRGLIYEDACRINYVHGANGAANFSSIGRFRGCVTPGRATLACWNPFLTDYPNITTQQVPKSKMVEEIISKKLQTRWFHRVKNLVIAERPYLTSSDYQLINDIARIHRIRNTLRFPASIAATIGCGYPDNALETLVVDLSEAVANLTMNSSAGLISNRYIDAMADTRLIEYLRKKRGIQIGDITAMKILRSIESQHVYPFNALRVQHGEVVAETIDRDEVRNLLLPTVRCVSDAVEKAISQITQDIQASIRRHGIILTGCGAEYSVFSNLLREELGWPIHLSKHPRHDVILGMEKAIRLKHEGVAHSALKKI